MLLLLLFAGGAAHAQIADFASSPASGCAPLAVQFTNTTSGPANTYSWNLGNSTTATTQHASTTYLTPGNYPVTLTVTGPGGSSTKTDTVRVFDKPSVSFVATTPTSGCSPHAVQFSSTVVANAPGNLSYSWNFGDGHSGSGANPAHTYATPGTYTVTLSVTNGAGCVGSAVQNAYITAWPKPVVNFSANLTAFCSAPATAVFTNTTTSGTAPFTSSWIYGDGGTGSGNSPSYTYATGGGYTVTMMVSDARGCKDTVTKLNYIGVNSANPVIGGPSSSCEGDTTFLFNATPGTTWARWNFGDGDTAFGNAGTHVFPAAGNYTVTMTTMIGNCTKNVTRSITVHPKPRAAITQNPPVPCPAPVAVGWSASSTYAISYAWSWTNGGTATGQSVSKNYLKNARGFEHDQLKLVTTSAMGCKDSLIIDTVYIRDILVWVGPGGLCRGPSSGCVPHEVTFGVELHSSLPPPPPGFCTELPYPVPITTWSWDLGDGTKSTLATPTHTYANPGGYNITSVVTTANGCRDSGRGGVGAATKVPPSFIAAPLVACRNTPITVINTTDSPYAFKYSWEFIEPNIEADSHIIVAKYDTGRFTVRIPVPGSYTVRMYTDNAMCLDTFFRDDYIKVLPAWASFTDSAYCTPMQTTVKFINNSIGATSLLWDFGDGDTSTDFSPVHTFPGLGLYPVTLIVHNDTTGCSDTLVRGVRLHVPGFDYNVSDTAICTGEGAFFSPVYYGYDVPLFSWLVDGIQSPYDTMASYAYWFNNRGRYDVTLLLRHGYCTDTLTKKEHILVARPDPAFGIDPPSGCLPLTVRFSDSSTNIPGVGTASRVWTFQKGDTLFGNDPVATHTYFDTGTHHVFLVVTDSVGCESARWPFDGYDSIRVFKPSASFTASDSGLCLSETVTFRDTSAAAPSLQHHWDFGDGTTGRGNPVSHHYTVRGLFNVTLIVTDPGGCTDTFTMSDTMRVDAPFAAFTMSDSMSICPPLQVTFSNSSAGTSALSYLWIFEAGSTPVVVTNPVHSFNNPGLYTVRLVATNANGCTDTARDTVRVLGYDGAFTYTPLTGCKPMKVQLSTALSGIPLITWDFGDGSTITTSAATVSHTYLRSGPYVPKVIFSDGAGCSSSSIGLDTIRVDEVSADFSWPVPCAGAAFTLKDSSKALYSQPTSWSWYFSGGDDTAAGPAASYTYGTGGTHAVTLVAANDHGCSDTVTKDVFINFLPEVRAPADTGVCPSDTALLVASGAQNYTWSPAPVYMNNCPVCDSAFVRIDNDTPGVGVVYTVTGTDGNGCVNRDSVRVFIQLKTTSTTGDGGEICVGQSFRLHAEGAHRYEWMPAATIDSPFIASPLATPERTTTYIVAAREGTCLVDSQRVVVIVRSRPLFNAGPDQTIAAGGAATLLPTQQGISRIVWRPDTTLSCNDCFRPNVNPLYTTTYYATGYNEWGCEASDSVTVHVRCNGSLVFIPNTFTPNGDGQNDYFFPRGRGIDVMSTFRVYNRWGEIVFERSNVLINDERAGWDGAFRGRALPPDVYVYTMQSACPSGEILQWKGDITLMR